jgi:hypothetical protein
MPKQRVRPRKRVQDGQLARVREVVRRLYCEHGEPVHVRDVRNETGYDREETQRCLWILTYRLNKLRYYGNSRYGC